jgi:hypothetical protein
MGKPTRTKSASLAEPREGSLAEAREPRLAEPVSAPATETGRDAPCGQYQICCSESAVRSLLARLLKDDELHAEFLRDPRALLAAAGIEVPPSVEVDTHAFERRGMRRLAATAGPLLNLTLGGRPMLRVRRRPGSQRSPKVKPEPIRPAVPN